MIRTGARRYSLPTLAAAALLATVPARAPAAQLDLEATLAPLIALEAHIPGHARSAENLGTIRGGTGVVIDGSGLVLTVGYLILEASRVDLYPDGLQRPPLAGDVVAWDERTGLGLVRSRAPLGVPPMPLGSAAKLAAGDAVIVASWERREGMVPSVVLDRRAYAGYWEYLLEDAVYVAPIHPAFPGTALLSLDGRLAGIGAFALTDSVDEEEVVGAVFIPVDALKEVLADLLLEGRSPTPRPWLGLYCEEVDGRLRVMRVPQAGPASRAGVRPGDWLLRVNGANVKDLTTFYRRLWSSASPGDRISLGLERDENAFTVEVRAADRHESLILPPHRR